MEISLMREKKLYDASFRGDIQSLNELFSEDELALNNCGRSSETPLHVAATRGHVEFASALLQRKPDLVNELDSRLRAPLHLASANGHVEMVKLLLEEDADVCLMEDEFGRTPLHLAAMVKGRVEVVNELVRARPQAIICPSNKKKTTNVLHSYVMRNELKALEQLVEVDHTFLNSQDGEGNTVLHKVVALKQMEKLEYLVTKTQLVGNLKNGNNFTALDMIKQMRRDPQTTKMRKLVKTVAATKSSSQGNNTKDTKENLLENKRSAILVAATVIAGMAFQAGVNPPGGVFDNNIDNYTTAGGKNVNVTAGTSILATNYSEDYILFGAFNTASFIAAISTVLLVIRGSTSFFGKTRFHFLKQKVFLWFLTGVIWINMTTMAITYIFAIISTVPAYKGSDRQWEGTVKIANYSVIAWLGMIFIILLVNIFHFFIYIIRKVKKCRERSRRNANEVVLLGRP